MKKPIHHLLIIRLSAMGDVAMTAPIIHQLRQQYPDVKISILTRSFFAPIFSTIENVHIINPDLTGRHKGILGLYCLSKELKNHHIDAVADLHNVLRTKILRFFLPCRISKAVIDKGRKEKKALTRTKNKLFKPLRKTYQRYADVFDELGLAISLDLNNHIPCVKSPQNLSETKVIGIAPFAAYSSKTYPIDKMTEVIQQLSSDYEIILLGGKEHQSILTNLENNYPNTKSMAGKYSFAEELDIISHLDLMISMDSGNAHLAAMYGVPTIVIWGNTHPYAGFAPFGEGHIHLLPDRDRYPLIPTSVYGNKIPEGYDTVFESISPQTIVDAVATKLNPI